jgi:hypothetical protein
MPVRYSDISAGPSTRRSMWNVSGATFVDYSKWTKAELKAEAEAYGLDSSGTKAALIKRLSA